MKKDIENGCKTCNACMSSVKNLKYQILSTEKFERPVLTERGQEIQIFFPVNYIQNKHVTGKPYIFIAIDRYSKRPVVQICNSVEMKEVIKFLESFILHRVPGKLKGDRGGVFISKD